MPLEPLAGPRLHNGAFGGFDRTNGSINNFLRKWKEGPFGHDWMKEQDAAIDRAEKTTCNVEQKPLTD
jgi:hypothetical protein